MRTGLDYFTAADLPTDTELFGALLPGAVAKARRWRLTDPEGTAADAVTNVIVERRYQDSWNPNGTGKLEHYLYTMVLNRLRDAARAQTRRRTRETVATYGSLGSSSDQGPTGNDGLIDLAAGDEFDSVELRASIGHFREVAADADRVARRVVDGEYRYPQGVSLVDLFDAITTAALDGTTTSTRALAAALGQRHHAGVVTAKDRLVHALEAADA